MQLTKHHGLGNDFLICLTREEPDGLSELASQMCDRRTGIGADGLILGLPGSNGADLSTTRRKAADPGKWQIWRTGHIDL